MMTKSNWVRFQSLAMVAVAVCLSTVVDSHGDEDELREQRLKMVERDIVREGIKSRAVILAVGTVPRHKFVLPKLHKQAYIDKALAIGFRQTISPPFIVAYMTESLDPQRGDKVLEIGTGSGYQAAVLSEIVKEVYSIEIVPSLAREAKKRLSRLGYDNVTTKHGDGYKGWAEHAPFDKIIVTCSPENVPQPLVDQLKEGGRMIVPLGERYQQVFHLFEKKDGRLLQTKLIPTLFVPMTGESEKKREVQPDPANPKIVNGSFEDDANKDGRVDNWHYQRQVTRVAGDDRDGEWYLSFTNTEAGRPSHLLQGMPVDARKVAFVNLSVDVRIDRVESGKNIHERPAMVIHFYDAVRREVGAATVGPWLRKQRWERDGRRIPVPPKAREAIVRVGLHGAVGEMSIDNLKISTIKR
jgi:protein-L-isoaspartate(D-aspartate) O-methyltransferase